MFALLIDDMRRGFSTLLFKFYFPTDYSVHCIQLKRRSRDVKNIFGVCFRAMDDDIRSDYIHPITLTDPIYCGMCKAEDYY